MHAIVYVCVHVVCNGRECACELSIFRCAMFQLELLCMEKVCLHEMFAMFQLELLARKTISMSYECLTLFQLELLARKRQYVVMRCLLCSN